jgi:hypothetical protein
LHRILILSIKIIQFGLDYLVRRPRLELGRAKPGRF